MSSTWSTAWSRSTWWWRRAPAGSRGCAVWSRSPPRRRSPTRVARDQLHGRDEQQRQDEHDRGGSGNRPPGEPPRHTGPAGRRLHRQGGGPEALGRRGTRRGPDLEAFGLPRRCPCGHLQRVRCLAASGLRPPHDLGGRQGRIRRRCRAPAGAGASQLAHSVEVSGARTTTCLTAWCPRSIDWATKAVAMVAAADPMATPTMVPLTPKIDAMTAAITAPAVEARIWRIENFTPGLSSRPRGARRRGR